MKYLEAIAIANKLRPNTLDDRLKARWLHDLDLEVSEVTRIPASDNPFPDDGELIMQQPYEDVYTLYLAAQIDVYNEEVDLYANDSVIFNNKLKEAIAWWRRNHRPEDSGQIKAW